MAKVSVTINSRKYDIGCDDGQEAHLARLAQYVDKRVDELVAAVGQVGDARLLVMASLLIADELSELTGELDVLRNERRGPTVAAAAMAIGDLDRLASRIEGIADRLERA